METIRTEGLTKRFGELTAVNGLTVAVREGEIFGLVGPDGAGKTTTMRMLSGVMDPSSGRAEVAGFDVARETDAVKEQIGYMSQRFGLYPDLTVLENIRFYADLYRVGRRERESRVEELLEFSHLGPFRKRLAMNLSGGMKQKLGLACALLHRPRVLLLDEPTNGVDPVSRREFWRILYRLLRDRVTIFVSTAYLDEAERCSRVGLIDHGKLLACGTPEEVKGLMTESILEVRTGRPRDAAVLLRQKLKEGRAGLFGDRVHVVTEDVARAEVEVRDTLEAGGVEVRSVGEVEPTLEDVFVAVLAKREGAGDA